MLKTNSNMPFGNHRVGSGEYAGTLKILGKPYIRTIWLVALLACASVHSDIKTPIAKKRGKLQHKKLAGILSWILASLFSACFKHKLLSQLLCHSIFFMQIPPDKGTDKSYAKSFKILVDLLNIGKTSPLLMLPQLFEVLCLAEERERERVLKQWVINMYLRLPASLGSCFLLQ